MTSCSHCETVAGMRRLLLIITTVGFLALAASADGFHLETVPAPWSLVNVSPTARYFAVGVAYGGCEQTPQISAVEETADAVTLTVTIQRPAQDPGDAALFACPAIAAYSRLGVHLSRPLAGRNLVGQWRHTFPSLADGLAPRMVGARAGDAMRALANRVTHTRLIGPVDGTVIRQNPPAGAPYNLVKGITLVAK
jgi:hypothetical protein